MESHAASWPTGTRNAPPAFAQCGCPATAPCGQFAQTGGGGCTIPGSGHAPVIAPTKGQTGCVHSIPDLPGPAGTIDDHYCCQIARARHDDPEAGPAETVCCQGAKIVCMIRPARERINPGFDPDTRLSTSDECVGGKVAWDVIDQCVIEHELRHVGGQPHLVCYGDGYPAEAFSPAAFSLAWCEHCEMFKDDVKCLNRGLAACNSLKAGPAAICRKLINEQLRQIKILVKGQCVPAPPFDLAPP